MQRNITSSGGPERMTSKVDLFQCVRESIKEPQDLFEAPPWFIHGDCEDQRRDITKGISL